MTLEEQEKLESRLAEIGTERLLADQGHGFDNTVGGPPEHRMHAGKWLSATLSRSNNTQKMLADGKKAFRRAVMERLYKETNEGRLGYFQYHVDLAEMMNCDVDVVDDALDYLEGEGLVEQLGIGSYSVTHRGRKEIEKALDSPNVATEHFPAIQVINNYGSNPIFAQGKQVTVSQINLTAAPPELQSLAEKLRIADGGVLSLESESLIAAAQASTSTIKLASVVEDVAAKTPEHRSILGVFKEEITKKVADKAIEGAADAVGWLAQHGPQIAAAISLALQHH